MKNISASFPQTDVTRNSLKDFSPTLIFYIFYKSADLNFHKYQIFITLNKKKPTRYSQFLKKILPTKPKTTHIVNNNLKYNYL